MFFGGCSESEENLLASLACFHKGRLPFSYLGVPLHGKRLKGADFSEIIDKMTSKVKAWSSRFLSYAGRLVLVKHVLSSIGSYWMRVLIFPKRVIKKISTICRNFLWSGAASGRRNLVAWEECVEVVDDQPLAWRSNSGPFSAKGAYEVLISGEPSKEWADLIWNDLAHPKHSFCAWLAVRDRLPTRARLRGSVFIDRRCCWCSEVEEDGAHLFFQCKFSSPIYSFLELIGIRVRWSSWEELIAWKASKRWSCRSQKLVALFIITAAIYEVWRARNKCIFEGDKASLEKVRELIWRMLKLKLELIKSKKKGMICYNWCSNLMASL
ncbi:hypothetical protein QQ045_027462 [Rhodiola kirilowii]